MTFWLNNLTMREMIRLQLLSINSKEQTMISSILQLLANGSGNEQFVSAGSKTHPSEKFNEVNSTPPKGDFPVYLEYSA